MPDEPFDWSAAWSDPDAAPSPDDCGLTIGQPVTRSPSALPFEWAGNVSVTLDGLWLVKNLLPRHGVAALYGHPGSGKSFLAMDIGCRVALEWDVAGRATRQGLVIYVCAEGQTGFRNRLAAFIQRHDAPLDMPFALIPTAIDLQAIDGDRAKLVSTIRDIAREARREPALIVIDTLSKTFGGGKENTDDMATYVANCAAVADAFKCCTLIVHHRPKDSESRDLRGHSSLRGGVETTILVETGKVKVAETLKQKDGPDGERLSFTLDQWELGINAEGEAVTSCVVEYCDAPVQSKRSPLQQAIARLSDQQKIVLTAIGDAIAEHGVPIGHPVPDDAYNPVTVGKMIEAGQVADKCKESLAAIIAGDPDKLADNAGRAQRRCIATLKTKQIIGTWGDWLWINY